MRIRRPGRCQSQIRQPALALKRQLPLQQSEFVWQWLEAAPQLVWQIVGCE